METLQKKSAKRIQKLTTQLANQIAAGEVIERPASVLKELLENSIDAESREIDVTVEKGGLRLIQVQDNGVGIHKEDLSLAIAQHATSKIYSLSDLENVRSLGFRGEALASIASVSKLTLSSYVAEQDSGWTLKSEGREGDIILCPSPKVLGTLVSVRDLFYNTPARKKFMRTEKTELMHLEEIFRRIALSKPHIGFSFKQGDKIVKRLPRGTNIENSQHRIAALCGQQFIAQAIYVSSESNGIKLYGYVGSLEGMRAQNDLQYFYVNGRIIRDKVINHAIRQAYPLATPTGRYPAYLLYLEMDPNALDVNVHPTKHEVRFRESRTVHDFITYVIGEALSQMESGMTSGHSTDLFQDSVQPSTTKAMASTNSLSIDAHMPKKNTFKVALNDYLQDRLTSRNINYNIDNTLVYNKNNNNSNIDYNTANTDVNTSSKEPFGKPIAVLGGELLLCENPQGLMIIDLKVACKIYIKQHLTKNYSQGHVAQKTLLLPKSIVLATNHEKLLGKLHEQKQPYINWETLGFEFSMSGPKSIMLRKIPAILSPMELDYSLLFKKVFNLKEMNDLNEVLDIIAETASSYRFTLENAETLIMNLMKENIISFDKDFCMETQIFRQVTVADLRAILF